MTAELNNDDLDKFSNTLSTALTDFGWMLADNSKKFTTFLESLTIDTADWIQWRLKL